MCMHITNTCLPAKLCVIRIQNCQFPNNKYILIYIYLHIEHIYLHTHTYSIAYMHIYIHTHKHRWHIHTYIRCYYSYYGCHHWMNRCLKIIKFHSFLLNYPCCTALLSWKEKLCHILCGIPLLWATDYTCWTAVNTDGVSFHKSPG